MGDRGNIVVRSSGHPKDDVWFYTHWSGRDIGKIAKKALDVGKPRWGDTSYLARIVFDTLTDGDKGETGFGISASIGDNENPILVIDDSQQLVFKMDEDELVDGRIPDGYKPKGAVSYDKFIG